MDIHLTHHTSGESWHLDTPGELVKFLDQRDPERADRDNYSANVTY